MIKIIEFLMLLKFKIRFILRENLFKLKMFNFKS